MSDLAARFGLTDDQLRELRTLLREESEALRTTAPDLSRSTDTWAPDGEVLPIPPGEGELPERYEDRGLLGVGGMGEVRRVFDRDLNRSVAMKLLRPELSVRGRALERFVEEAQTSAQLQHPGVLPVYEMGRLDDGRLYFTMQEIRGRTLVEAIAELHEASAEGSWRPGASGIGFRRLIEAMRTVCVAVGYAHRRGVIHRDLKPANLMIGDDGEVLVVDWGLARVQEVVVEHTDPVITEGGPKPRDAQATSLAGTPAFMPPEQARGDAVGPATDVWALGAVLYQVLCGEHPHAEITDVHQLIVTRMMGVPPRPPTEITELPLPEELVEAVQRALASDPAERQADGAELASQIGVWLDGEARRERARELVALSVRAEEASRAKRALAAEGLERAKALLEGVAEWAPEADKLAAWEEEDRARALSREAELTSLDAEQKLHAALTYAPDLIAARRSLALHYRRLHVEAEIRRDEEAALRAEAFLRAQASALPAGSLRAELDDYLVGDGRLTLVTDPPGAEVVLHRFETHRRRLVPRAKRVIGPTPLIEHALPSGSWLAVIRHPDCEEVRYPIHIARQGHWDGVEPGGTDPVPIPLPAAGSLTERECYVPPGWFQVGGDPDAPGGLAAHWRWCHGFVMDRDPATNRDWVAFADAVAEAEGAQAAFQVVPTDFSGIERDEGIPIYRQDAAGRFELGPDPDGDLWELDWPVVMITMPQVERFIAWRRQTSAQDWRLPGELEWEKAARGVDGRLFPWGDGFDPSWVAMRARRPTGLVPVDAMPVDVSVYGVRGLGGNCADWCLEQDDGLLGTDRVAVPEAIQRGDRQAGRGGTWSGPMNACRAASRGFCNPNRPLYSQGVRLVRPLPS